MKTRRHAKPKPRKSAKKLPFYKQKWFLMMAGLAVFIFIVAAQAPHTDSDILGSSTRKNSLWSMLSSMFSKSARSKKTTATGSATTTTAPTASANVALTALPLGDKKYWTSPKKGYIYSRQTTFNGGGAFTDGPWINAAAGTWDLTKKATVDGNVSWPNAKWTISASGTTRTLTGNGLPAYHNTGTYPIGKTDDAYDYDHNPNSIQTQTLTLSLPTNPALLSTPECVGGEVGIMLSGVPMFNGFDAGGRDAVAHEVQDDCSGHPQSSGLYHYHGPSNCLKDTTGTTEHSALEGYAYDGFGIYGLKGEGGKEVTSADLDECHDHTHTIAWDGKTVSMYHYHLTHDFPYSIGCFRGKKQVTGPLGGKSETTGSKPGGTSAAGQMGGKMPTPSGQRRPPPPQGGVPF